ncbi:hypothetical protein L2728_21075, partial [Shewanella chilikensis]|nr:hypothetical protein [Shewanella chilikensis]
NTDSGKWHKSVLNKSGISVQMIPEQVFKCFRNRCSDPAGICNSNRSGPRVFSPTKEFHDFGSKKVRLAFTTKIVNNKGNIVYPDDNWIEFFSTYGTGDFWKISKLKIERGTKATDWSPAPEDHYVYADEVQSAAESYALDKATAAQSAAQTYALAKANGARDDAINSIAFGNFNANIGLISTLFSNSGLFNQLQAAIASFGGLTADSIASMAIATNHLHAGAVTVDKVAANAITADKVAALAIATNHLQTGSVTSDKVTADTAMINKLFASQGLFDALQARLAVFGGLAAQSIAAKAISTDKLAVTARNLVNNVSNTGVRDGWSLGSVVSHIHNGKNTTALELSTNSSKMVLSDWFDVDQTKIYEVNLTIARNSGGNIGSRYFGFYANGDGLVTQIPPDSRTPGAETDNPYFWYGDIDDGDYRQMRAYIIGSEVDPASIPDSLNVISSFQLNASQTQVRLRILNYYNDGVTTVDRYLNMSVTELGGGQISANQLLANSALFNQLKAKIASFGGLTATEIHADTALINKLVSSSALFNDLQARLAVFGGLTANSIAAGAILGNHIKAGEKITSPIIEGGEVRLVGSSFMKVSAASAFGPDGLIEWYGPKLLVGGNPDWANLRKNNAITYLAANGDAYFGGSLSAGILKNSVATSDKNKYEAGTAPVSLGPFSTNGRTKVVVVSFDMRASTRYSSNPGSVSAPVLKWQLQKLINGNWTSLTSGTYQGTASVYFENDDPSNTYWQESQSCQGSTTYTDTSTSSADVTYRILVTSYYRNATNGVIERQILSIISTEQ